MLKRKSRSQLIKRIVLLHVSIILGLAALITNAQSVKPPVVMISTYGYDGDPPLCFQVGREPFGVPNPTTADNVPVYARTCTYLSSIYNTYNPMQRYRVEYYTQNTFTIRSDYSNKCLEVANSSTANGAAIRQKTCNGGLNQRWMLQTAEKGPTVRFRSVHSDKCMWIAGDNSAVVQEDCDDVGEFHILPMGYGLRIQSLWSGKCLDVNNTMAYFGAKVQQWTCLGGGQTNQIWNLTIQNLPAVGGGNLAYTSRWRRGARYIIRPLYTNMSIAPHPTGWDNGSWVRQIDYDANDPWQWWELYPDYNYGLFFRIKWGQYNVYCLDQHNGSGNVNGAHVQLWECHGDRNQSWWIRQLDI